jgi:hypothetical protein
LMRALYYDWKQEILNSKDKIVMTKNNTFITSSIEI